MAQDVFLDGRFVVTGAKGWLNLGNPVSLTRIITNTIVPNVPVLASLPYTFQNGLTAVTGTPTIVSLGGTLLDDTTIDGAGFEFQVNADTISNFAIDYQIDVNNASINSSDELSISNSAFVDTCSLGMIIQSKLGLDTYLRGTTNTIIDGSKYVIQGKIPGNLHVASGFYNSIEDCIPVSIMEQSFSGSTNSISGYSSVRTDDEVTIERFRDDSINAISTRINLEGSVVIEATNQTTNEFNRIVTSPTDGVVITGYDDVTLDYSYELPNTRPNNGDIMISDMNGRLHYKPLETHVQALNIITGAVSQIAKFHIPFIEDHVCTRINFISDSSSTGTINVTLIDELNAVTIGNYDLVIDNVNNYWGGTTYLIAPFTSSNTNNMWTITVVSNTQAPTATALYLNLTFVPKLI